MKRLITIATLSIAIAVVIRRVHELMKKVETLESKDANFYLDIDYLKKRFVEFDNVLESATKSI